MLKPLLALAALAISLAAAPARSQTYDTSRPVCMHTFGDLQGDQMDCTFISLAQCVASASGRAATCLDNPHFARAAPPPANTRRRRAREVSGAAAQ